MCASRPRRGATPCRGRRLPPPQGAGGWSGSPGRCPERSGGPSSASASETLSTSSSKRSARNFGELLVVLFEPSGRVRAQLAERLPQLRPGHAELPSRAGGEASASDAPAARPGGGARSRGPAISKRVLVLLVKPVERGRSPLSAEIAEGVGEGLARARSRRSACSCSWKSRSACLELGRVHAERVREVAEAGRRAALEHQLRGPPFSLLAALGDGRAVVRLSYRARSRPTRSRAPLRRR